jgi:signal transduction histidine kinase
MVVIQRTRRTGNVHYDLQRGSYPAPQFIGGKGADAVNRKLLIIVGGLLALTLVPLLAWNGLVQQGNASAFDILLRLSPPPSSSAPASVVLLAIDDETVSRYGPLPLNRAVVAEALNRITVAEPQVLAVDVLLSEKTREPDDASLAGAFSRFRRVVLAVALEATEEGKDPQWLPPLPAFQRYAFALGHVHFEPDRDGLARTLLLTKANADNRYWALGFEAFRSALGAQGPPTEYAKELKLGNRAIPVAASSGRLLWIHYHGPEGAFRRVSLASVLDGRTPASTFAGKAVILGVTAQGAGDRVYTPFSTGLGMSGIEIHANVFATLMDGAYLFPLSAPAEFLLLLVIAALVATAAWWKQGRFLSSVAITGFIAIPVFSYWTLRTGVIVPIASALVIEVGASLAGLLGNTRFIRSRLSEAIAGRQDYAYRLQAVAHEIKTPLTAIHASSQLMTEPDIPEPKKEEIAQRIHKEAGRLSSVVTTFLDVERISAGVLKLQKRQVELAAVVADAVERSGLLALKKRIRIEQDLEPGVVAAADADLLQFAVYNLLVNAIKYSPDGSSIRIGLRSSGRNACLVVEDQGCGIEPAEQERIFDRFYRTKKHQEDAKGGSGVGLALVKEIVTQHGGRIEVESAPGKGSTFSVFLPREAAYECKTAGSVN